jgi:hypothetical protein
MSRLSRFDLAGLYYRIGQYASKQNQVWDGRALCDTDKRNIINAMTAMQAVFLWDKDLWRWR